MRKQKAFQLFPSEAHWHLNPFKIWQLYESPPPFWRKTYWRRKFFNRRYFWPVVSGKHFDNNRRNKTPECIVKKVFFNPICVNYTRDYQLWRSTIFNKKYYKSEKWLTSRMNRKPLPKPIVRLPIVRKSQSETIYV